MDKKSFIYSEVLVKLQYYCTYQDRCHYEVEQKLYEFSLSQEEKENAIISLIQEKYLNEERFTRSFIRGKFYQKKWGKIKIKMELKQKKIPEKLILSCFDEIDQNDYVKTIKELYHKKYKSLNDKMSTTKNRKITSYLIGKGYEFEEIKNIIYTT